MSRFDEDLQATIQTFLHKHVVNEEGSYVTSDMVVKQLLPFLFSKGLTNKISLNNLPELQELVEQLLGRHYQRGDWVEDAEEYTLKFEKAFKDCVLLIADSKRKERASGIKVVKEKPATGRTFSTLPEMISIINEFEERIQALEKRFA